jgi:hypothetical protein
MQLLNIPGMARPLLWPDEKLRTAPRYARTPREPKGGCMGDYLPWLVLGAFVVLIFCIYSLSSQLERCVRLAVAIITGNQRKILDQLATLNRSSDSPPSRSVVPFERRIGQRRREHTAAAGTDDRRQQRGRRRDDLAAFGDARDGELSRSAT